MAKNKVDSCIFCGNTPCTCNIGPPKKVSKRAPRKKSATAKPSAAGQEVPQAEASATDPIAAMRAAAAAAKQAPVLPPPQSGYASATNELTNRAFLEEEGVKEALLNLLPILHPSEIEKIKQLIPAPDRASHWKERHARKA